MLGNLTKLDQDTKTPIDFSFPVNLVSLIISHLDDKYKYVFSLTIIQNVQKLYAQQAACYVVCRNKKELEALIKRDPWILSYETEISDHKGRKIKGTPLQIAMANIDVNVHSNTTETSGIIEILRQYISPEQFVKQASEWFHLDWEKVTRARMNRYRIAIQQFLEDLKQIDLPVKDSTLKYKQLIKNRDILCKPIIDKYKSALVSHSDEVITSGYIYDLQILVDFFDLAKNWVSSLARNYFAISEKNLYKIGLFLKHGFGSLQAYAPVCDLQTINRGIHTVNNGASSDESLDFSSGIPESIAALGSDYFMDVYQIRYIDPIGGGQRKEMPRDCKVKDDSSVTFSVFSCGYDTFGRDVYKKYVDVKLKNFSLLLPSSILHTDYFSHAISTSSSSSSSSLSSSSSVKKEVESAPQEDEEDNLKNKSQGTKRRRENALKDKEEDDVSNDSDGSSHSFSYATDSTALFKRLKSDPNQSDQKTSPKMPNPS